MEFLKLERVEIGGLKGRTLSGRIIAISQEFNDHFTVFASKTYDVLDPEDESFLRDYKQFQSNICDLDRRLASILCQAFDDCFNLESVFKVSPTANLFIIVISTNRNPSGQKIQVRIFNIIAWSSTSRKFWCKNYLKILKL